MANFESELMGMMRRFTPEGGFGIPNIAALRELLERQNQMGLRQAVQSDIRGSRQGQAQFVGGAFAPGARRGQFSQSLLDALTNLQAQHGQLAGNQRMALLRALAPIAYQKSQEPSWFSKLAGGLFGTAASLFGPGLAMKLLGNPQLDLINKLLGGGGSGGNSGGLSSGTLSMLGDI